jgi:hypothetical protein
MKKISTYTLLTLTSLFATSVLAAGASTFSGVTNDAPSLEIISINGAAGTNSPIVPILSTTIKVPGAKKSLLIGVSLESGILLQAGKIGPTQDCAGVNVTVKIDGHIVDPGKVKFNANCQVQTPTTLSMLNLCTDTAPLGIIDVSTECTFTDVDLKHLLDTTSANHFNFIASNVGPGKHIITVEANVTASSSVTGSAQAVVNLGTLSVQVVKPAKAHHQDHHHGHDFDDLIAE